MIIKRSASPTAAAARARPTKLADEPTVHIPAAQLTSVLIDVTIGTYGGRT